MFQPKNIITAATLAVFASAGVSLSAQSNITVAMQLEPPHLDPTSAAAGAIDSVLYSNVFEGLTRFASDGSIIAGLAESWDISSDGTVYTFNLRSGVKFHDGTTMDANDVKFSLDRARAEDSTNAQKALFSGITDVMTSMERISPDIVAFTISEALRRHRLFWSIFAFFSYLDKATRLTW